ncbi:hypothetical protein C8P67_111146 [Flavobacterium aquicola]|uniref:Uncharacterized protein n=1 Tax=Flavobacterium aquicola TaxID=1682742 RepID=A0A3E0ED26_9FLAO|nr:hypothetical protein C8P67_111146 [Flavobacterium aquicola]
MCFTVDKKRVEKYYQKGIKKNAKSYDLAFFSDLDGTNFNIFFG